MDFIEQTAAVKKYVESLQEIDNQKHEGQLEQDYLASEFYMAGFNKEDVARYKASELEELGMGDPIKASDMARSPGFYRELDTQGWIRYDELPEGWKIGGKDREAYLATGVVTARDKDELHAKTYGDVNAKAEMPHNGELESIMAIDEDSPWFKSPEHARAFKAERYADIKWGGKPSDKPVEVYDDSGLKDLARLEHDALLAKDSPLFEMGKEYEQEVAKIERIAADFAKDIRQNSINVEVKLEEASTYKERLFARAMDHIVVSSSDQEPHFETFVKNTQMKMHRLEMLADKTGQPNSQLMEAYGNEIAQVLEPYYQLEESVSINKELQSIRDAVEARGGKPSIHDLESQKALNDKLASLTMLDEARGIIELSELGSLERGVLLGSEKTPAEISAENSAKRIQDRRERLAVLTKRMDYVRAEQDLVSTLAHHNRAQNIAAVELGAETVEPDTVIKFVGELKEFDERQLATEGPAVRESLLVAAARKHGQPLNVHDASIASILQADQQPKSSMKESVYPELNPDPESNFECVAYDDNSMTFIVGMNRDYTGWGNAYTYIKPDHSLHGKRNEILRYVTDEESEDHYKLDVHGGVTYFEEANDTPALRDIADSLAKKHGIELADSGSIIGIDFAHPGDESATKREVADAAIHMHNEVGVLENKLKATQEVTQSQSAENTATSHRRRRP